MPSRHFRETVRRWFVYALAPMGEMPCYVGITADPAGRFRDHLACLSCKRDRRWRIAVSLPLDAVHERVGAEGSRLVVCLLDSFDATMPEAEARESWWVRECERFGCALVNVRRGRKHGIGLDT